MIRILAIGNSFSVDALHYFKQIADAAGIETECVNLYIGGCSLERHAQNIQNDSADYERYYNGVATGHRISCREALLEQLWDIVTVQQASHDSGMPETYEAYGSQVLDYVKKLAPQAKIWFHRTWAYEHGSNHDCFPRYGCDQETMFRALLSASSDFAQRHDLPVIPSGNVIQALRGFPEFDVRQGGLSLCLDGFHMSRDYGRYAVAATWVEMLTGADVRGNSFRSGDMREDYVSLIQNTVHEVCAAQKIKNSEI